MNGSAALVTRLRARANRDRTTRKARAGGALILNDVMPIPRLHADVPFVHGSLRVYGAVVQK